MISEYGDRIAVGLDVRGTRLAARGWTTDGGELDDALDRLESAGCARYVVTDIDKDGMLPVPNLDLLPRCAPGPPARLWPAAACPAWRTCGPSRAGAPRGGGRDRRQGAVRGGVHAARSAGRRGSRGPVNGSSDGDGDGGSRSPAARTGSRSSAIRALSPRVTTSSSPAVPRSTGRTSSILAMPVRADRAAIANVASALAALGASLADVVQDQGLRHRHLRWQEYGRAHGEAFGWHYAGHVDDPDQRAHRPAHAGRGRSHRLQAWHRCRCRRELAAAGQQPSDLAGTGAAGL